MSYDFTTPPRAFADPTDANQLARRSWVLGVRDALADLCERVANKDQPNGYLGLDSAGRAAPSAIPTVLSTVRSATGQSGTVTPNAAAAAGGGLLNYTATGNLVVAAPINGVDHQQLRIIVLASGGPRTVTFDQNGSTSLIYPVGHLPMSFHVPQNLALVADLVYSALAGCWLITAADVEGTADSNQFSAAGPGSSVQSVAANTGGIVVAWPTNLTTTAMVTKSATGAGHQFTLNRTGLWSISWHFLLNNQAAGSKRSLLQVTNGPSGAPAYLAGGAGAASGTGQGQIPVGGSLITRLTVGAIALVHVYSVAADSIASSSGFISFNFLGP